MVAKITINDLDPETRKKLHLSSNDPKPVKPRVIALGRILADLQGLTNREALFTLKQAIILVRGYNKDKSHN